MGRFSRRHLEERREPRQDGVSARRGRRFDPGLPGVEPSVGRLVAGRRYRRLGSGVFAGAVDRRYVGGRVGQVGGTGRPRSPNVGDMKNEAQKISVNFQQIYREHTFNVYTKQCGHCHKMQFYKTLYAACHNRHVPFLPHISRLD